jgi:hypothetical protein
MQNGTAASYSDGVVVPGVRGARASDRPGRWATVCVVGTEHCMDLELDRGAMFGRGGCERPVDVVLADLNTLSRVAVELTLSMDAVWVRAHQRHGGVVEVLLPGGHLLTCLREGNETPVGEVVFRVRVRVDRGVFDLHVVQNALPQPTSEPGATASTHSPWRPAVLLSAVPGEDWRRVLALVCAMTVYPDGVVRQADTPAVHQDMPGTAKAVSAPEHGWDAQVPAFKQVLTMCGYLFGGKPSGKWLSDRLDKALAAFGEPSDNRDKLVRLVPLVLRIGLIDEATMLALAHQVQGLPLPAHLAHLACEPSSASGGEQHS